MSARKFVMVRVIVETSVVEAKNREDAKDYALDGWQWGPFATWDQEDGVMVGVHMLRHETDQGRIGQRYRQKVVDKIGELG
jgi:hypothetical protein